MSSHCHLTNVFSFLPLLGGAKCYFGDITWFQISVVTQNIISAIFMVSWLAVTRRMLVVIDCFQLLQRCSSVWNEFRFIGNDHMQCTEHISLCVCSPVIYHFVHSTNQVSVQSCPLAHLSLSYIVQPDFHKGGQIQYARITVVG